MIKVSVKSTDVRNQSGTGKTSGKPYSLNFQTVFMWLVDRHGKPEAYPTKVEIILDKNEQGSALFWPVGEYTLAPESIYVSRTGDISISPKLQAIAAPAPAAKV